MNSRSIDRSTRPERDEFRRRLKEEWERLWRERFDDRVRAEGVSVSDYPLLFVDRGFVVFASRNAKMPNFSEIAGFWASQGCIYSPDPFEGGWGKFVRTEMKKLGKSATVVRNQPKNGEKGQRKKSGRGWLHIE